MAGRLSEFTDSTRLPLFSDQRPEISRQVPRASVRAMERAVYMRRIGKVVGYNNPLPDPATARRMGLV